MKEENFIGKYKLNAKICDDIVEYYHNNKSDHIKVDKPWKQSTDLCRNLAKCLDIPCLKAYEAHLSACVVSYVDRFPMLLKLNQFGVLEDSNIQHYKPNQGFLHEHCERPGNLNDTIKRLLVFMTYLNTVPGGGTRFINFDHTETAVKGKTLIWPSDWTHTHVGQISKKHDKIIITGWISHIWG